MVRWDDVKADVKEVLSEFKKHKIGWIGVSLIAFMVLLGALAPVLAPGVHEEWGRGHSRWQDLPANAPPVWLDWVTSEDYARHTTVDEWERYPRPRGDADRIGRRDGEAFYSREVLFDELGNRSFEVRNADGDVLGSHTVEIFDGEPIDNVDVEDFEVTLSEDYPPEGVAPVEYEIEATLIHDGSEENRTVSLNVDGRSIDTWEMSAENNTETVDVSHTFVTDGNYVIDFREEDGERGSDMEIVKVGFGIDVKIRNFNVFIDEEDLVADMQTLSIENQLDEEIEAVYRINELDLDEEGEVVSRDLIHTRTWTLESFERIEDLADEYTLPAEGDYEFIFGTERIERDVTVEEEEEEEDDEEDEENGDDETESTSLTTTKSESRDPMGETDGEETDADNEVAEEETEARADGIDISVSGPDEVIRGDSKIHLFSLSLIGYEGYLEEGEIDPQLRDAFIDEGFEVSEDAVVSEEAGKWFIYEGEHRMYQIKVEDELKVYDPEPIEVDIVNPEERTHDLYFYMVSEDEEEQLLQEIVVPSAGVLYRHRYVFNYNMEYDVPPREIFTRFSGSADSYRRRRVLLRRPDGVNITYEDLPRDGVGEFSETVSMQRRLQAQEAIHSHATHYLRTEHGIGPTRAPHNLNLQRVLFSERGEDWMERPDRLKGDYQVEVQLDGINLEVDEASVTFSGAVYGVMGTDSGRRDIFQGWVWGARYGLIAGGLVALTTIFFGTSFGMTSAYYGGWVDEFMQRVNEILMGIPTLPILIITLQFWRRSIWVFVLIYALLMWRGAAKVIRSRGLQVAKDTYIEAAESLGSGSGRIIAKHMIPQILPYAIAQAALLVPIVIMAEAGLHILGLGDPNIVTWGTLLNQARTSGSVYNWRESWFWILFPGVGMMLVGFGFISTGMAIERIINPKMKQR